MSGWQHARHCRKSGYTATDTRSISDTNYRFFSNTTSPLCSTTKRLCWLSCMAKQKTNNNSRAYRKLRARFTGNLRKIREERFGLTQEQAAERCRMVMQQFQQIESGKLSPTLRTISKLTDGLGIDAVELFVPFRKPE